jgi:chromosomal replication initiation ATPase DnaA
VTAVPVAIPHARTQSTRDYERVNEIALELGYDADALRGRDRTRAMSYSRRIVIQKLRAEGWSYPRIGRALGGRHHTTILAYVADKWRYV